MKGHVAHSIMAAVLLHVEGEHHPLSSCFSTPFAAELEPAFSAFILCVSCSSFSAWASSASIFASIALSWFSNAVAVRSPLASS